MTWRFGVGHFIVGLNWIATAFTYQAAMPAWLGVLAVIVLSLYLALFPALSALVAWRIGRIRNGSLEFVLAPLRARGSSVNTCAQLCLPASRGIRWASCSFTCRRCRTLPVGWVRMACPA